MMTVKHDAPPDQFKTVACSSFACEYMGNDGINIGSRRCLQHRPETLATDRMRIDMVDARIPLIAPGFKNCPSPDDERDAARRRLRAKQPLLELQAEEATRKAEAQQ